MKFQYDGYNWLIRLEKGELVIENLREFVRNEKIKGGWISGLGAAMWAELGYYDLAAKEYRFQKLEQMLEITSLQGNIAWEGDEPVLHLHGVFSDDKMRAFGGHVKEMETAGTCEIFLHRWFQAGLARFHDNQTGLKLLDI